MAGRKEKKEKERTVDERTTLMCGGTILAGWKPTFLKDRYGFKHARPYPKKHQPPIPITIHVLPQGKAPPPRLETIGKLSNGDVTGRKKSPRQSKKKEKGDTDDEEDEGLKERQKKYGKYQPFDELAEYENALRTGEIKGWHWKKCFHESFLCCLKKPKGKDNEPEWPDDEVIEISSTPPSTAISITEDERESGGSFSETETSTEEEIALPDVVSLSKVWEEARGPDDSPFVTLEHDSESLEESSIDLEQFEDDTETKPVDQVKDEDGIPRKKGSYANARREGDLQQFEDDIETRPVDQVKGEDGIQRKKVSCAKARRKGTKLKGGVKKKCIIVRTPSCRCSAHKTSSKISRRK